MTEEIPQKVLLGKDRNSMRIKRVIAQIQNMQAVNPSDPRIESYYEEIQRRLHPKEPSRPVGVRIGVPKMGK